MDDRLVNVHGSDHLLLPYVGIVVVSTYFRKGDDDGDGTWTNKYRVGG